MNYTESESMIRWKRDSDGHTVCEKRRWTTLQQARQSAIYRLSCRIFRLMSLGYFDHLSNFPFAIFIWPNKVKARTTHRTKTWVSCDVSNDFWCGVRFGCCRCCCSCSYYYYYFYFDSLLALFYSYGTQVLAGSSRMFANLWHQIAGYHDCHTKKGTWLAENTMRTHTFRFVLTVLLAFLQANE